MSKGSVVFMTGFPGFIAGRLVRELLDVYGPKSRYFFLVEPRFASDAEERCKEIASKHPKFKWEVFAGDIRKADLGMNKKDLAKVKRSTTHVWHLAALYNLAAPQSLSYSINVDGTMHVLDLCAAMPKLQRLLYISTCYVAGERTGRVMEADLDVGQDHKNHYESTKCWAEKLVQHRSNEIPTVIFRPAIVVGDSKTGETAKGDGPYFVMRLLMRLPGFIPGVHFGPSTGKVNLVPVDFLIEAMAALAEREDALGKVYHLADPDPYTAAEIMVLLSKHTGHGKVRATLPRKAVIGLLKSRRMQRLLGIPRQAFAYFDIDVEFDTTNTTEALAESGVRCPRLPDYISKLVAYGEQHPEIFIKV